MAEVIDKTPRGVEQYDSECPECGSGDVRRSTTFDVDELSTLSLWCGECEYGWMESA